ncbi:Gfo/Idh/MocA family oxidoreductase [Vibrio penaeicida]|uniref:Gfo/Idh/MocA family protein n=1 Tax=Vibrio penaeicida TaxID=104609 RepID=UPI002734DBC5|nr:Gfo/Idh/MocA family oxidoreductase [Vibrio penaeicida]MDP2575123.1 Gfo/Idh/MocA family oxidoreductase [Vibrio penaeicida]
MIKLAVVGTNWITEHFVKAALSFQQYSLAAVYSRNHETGVAFAENFGCETIITDFDALCANKDIDAVYLASPNSFHCEQAIALMRHGKHVICEKPLASNYEEVERMFAVAHEHNVVLFEAFKTNYLPNFELIKNKLSEISPVRKAILNYCQYSSRYQKYLNGENPNTFNPEFSNGSTMDIGYYCIASAISLFGEPKSVHATATILESGVDGQGSVLLEFEGLDAVITHSKVADSAIPSEVQGENGNIVIHHLSEAQNIEIRPRGGVTQNITLPSNEMSMVYEAQHFAKLVNGDVTDSNAEKLSKLTAKVLTEVRKQIGVVYPAD